MFQFPLRETRKVGKWELGQAASTEIRLLFSNRPAILPVIKNRSNILYIERCGEQIKRCYCRPTMANIWMNDSHLMHGLNPWCHYDFGTSPGKQHDWSVGCSDANLSQLLFGYCKASGRKILINPLTTPLRKTHGKKCVSICYCLGAETEIHTDRNRYSRKSQK